MRRSYNKNNLYPIQNLNQLQSRKEKEKIITSRIHQFNFQQMKKFEKKKDAAVPYPNNPGSNYNTANPGEETKPSLKIKVLASRTLPMHTSPKTEKNDDLTKHKEMKEPLKMIQPEFQIKTRSTGKRENPANYRSERQTISAAVKNNGLLKNSEDKGEVDSADPTLANKVR